MIRKAFFYVFLLLTAAILFFYAIRKKDRSLAIVAEVEPQKTAISFHKPVRIKAIHVKPGQKVKKGDLLLEVERPDLALDIQNTQNELRQLESAFQKLEDNFHLERQLNQVSHNQRILKIDQELKELEYSQKADSSLYANLASSAVTRVDQEVAIEKEKLLRTRTLELERFRKENQQLNINLKADQERVSIRKQIVTDELLSLENEISNLLQFATLDGTIGSVSVQLQELVSPFNTILSIYDENPNIIKAYMNEKATADIQLGQLVMVEAINRKYAIEGEIIEVGSRIVSYPKQMNPLAQQPLWGREIFVQIPKENNFLNGEKVYVIIESL